MHDTQTQIDRLIELAIVQRTELKQLVEQLPELREHLNAEIEKVFDEVEPQLRVELEDWMAKQTADQTAKLGATLEAKITELAKALEVSTQARYSAILAEREKNFALAAEARAKIAEHAASLPETVKGIVDAELARFPRAGEIDQLRKEFAEPRGLNPRGKWTPDQTYNRLDLVAYNGDSYVSNHDGNTEKPSRTSANWTLSAARGAGGGGGGITSLNDILNAPTSGQIIGSEGSQFVPKTLTAGTGISITDAPGSITIDATGAQETLTATVKNAESVAITKGQVVYLFSATGGFPSVKLAYNTSDATSAKTFGVVSDTSIAPNGTGTVTCVGVVSNLNLGTYSDGDTVYLGATPGSFTATKPYAPNHLVYVGIIERANAGNGELYVRIQNGYELDEIHDVQINAPKLAGQTLIYDQTNDLWKNARLTAGVGVSISNADSAITISADGGVNYQGTWNASTNTPTLTSSVGTKGFYYVVSVAGSTNLNGVTDWKVGDWAIFNGTAWEKVDTTDQVSSVFGRTGAVVGVSTDYSAVGITNTAVGATNPSTGAFTTLNSSSTTQLNGTTIPASKTLVVTTDKISALAATSSSELAGVITDETGSGALVFANSPTLVTPSLGTPSVLVGTNITGTAAGLTAGNVTTNANLTGAVTSVGNATSLGSFSSANLAAALTDETGSGANVFANTPTLITPNIGAATGTSVNLSGAGTFGGNLTVNGTGTSSVAGVLQVGPLSPLNQLDVSKSGTNNRVSVQVASSDNGIHFIDAGGTRYTIGSSFGLVAPGDYFAFNRFSGSAWSEMGRFVSTGNLLLGTTTDSSNGKLQLATHTTSAGGIAFGTDWGIYRKSQYTLGINVASGAKPLFVYTDVTNVGFFDQADVNTTTGWSGYYITPGDKSLKLATNNTTALTLDSSQNATFAGNLTVSGTQSSFAASTTVSGTRVTINTGVAQGIDIYRNDANANFTAIRFRDTTNANTNAQIGWNGTQLRLDSTTALLTGDTTVSGNLTVSGTGTSSFAGRLFGINTTSPDDFGAAYSTLQINAVSAGGGAYSVYKNVADSINFRVGADGQGVINVVSNHPLLLNTNNTERLRVTASGNVLAGTTTDSSNGKLQLATHTTSAGGIGFGTETSLFRSAGGNLCLNDTGTNAAFSLCNAGTKRADFYAQGSTSTLIIGPITAGWSTVLMSGAGTTALTLDSSQNATFAGSIKTVAPSGGTAKPWELGEAATVSPTSPNRTIRVEIDGTIYYIHAKTTND